MCAIICLSILFLFYFWGYILLIIKFVHSENVHSEKRHILAGVPQGAVISPILFSIFINDIPQKNQSNISFSLLYADDLSSSFIFKRSGNIESIVNKYLRFVKEWLCKWKLNMSAHKCSYIVFSQNKKINHTLKLYLSKSNQKKEDLISKENNPVFLGVIFDKYLNFNKHFSNMYI
jgi:hypothetical protein